MSDTPLSTLPAPADALPVRSPAARRALAEAAARRELIDAKARAAAPEPERNGRGGPEPVRYDDWEIAGRAIDF